MLPFQSFTEPICVIWAIPLHVLVKKSLVPGADSPAIESELSDLMAHITLGKLFQPIMLGPVFSKMRIIKAPALQGRHED